MPDAATPSAPPLQQALVALANRQSLSESLAAAVFGVVMRGEASPAQIAGLLVGLRVKGETPDEVAGAARALRAAMVHVDADAVRQVVGGADRDRAPLLAAALARLGTEHALVVHGRVGMDEISPIGVTDVWEVRGDEIRPWELDPGAHHLAVNDAGALRGGDPPANAARLRRLLERERGDAPGLAAVLLNAGAAVYVAGLAGRYGEGIARARDAVGSGAAGEALERLRRASPSTSG